MRGFEPRSVLLLHLTSIAKDACMRCVNSHTPHRQIAESRGLDPHALLHTLISSQALAPTRFTLQFGMDSGFGRSPIPPIQITLLRNL